MMSIAPLPWPTAADSVTPATPDVCSSAVISLLTSACCALSEIFATTSSGPLNPAPKPLDSIS